MSNRATLSTATPKTATVDIGDGRQVTIRELSGAGRVAYLKAFQEAQNSGGIRPSQVAAMALVEQDGVPSFDPAKPEDLAFLDGLSGEVLDKIAVEFYRLSGLTSKAVEDAKGN